MRFELIRKHIHRQVAHRIVRQSDHQFYLSSIFHISLLFFRELYEHFLTSSYRPRELQCPAHYVLQHPYSSEPILSLYLSNSCEITSYIFNEKIRNTKVTYIKSSKVNIHTLSPPLERAAPFVVNSDSFFANSAFRSRNELADTPAAFALFGGAIWKTIGSLAY